VLVHAPKTRCGLREEIAAVLALGLSFLLEKTRVVRLAEGSSSWGSASAAPQTRHEHLARLLHADRPIRSLKAKIRA
jgi:hypothetical protein